MTHVAGESVVRLAEEREKDGLSLTPPERMFCEAYFLDEENAGNATRCYMQLFPDASYATASVEASGLLKQPKIRKHLAALQERAIENVAAQIQPWSDLLPVAQAIVVATAQGRMRNRLAYEASVYLVNRCLGNPTATSEVHVINHERIAKAVGAFTRRITDEQRRRAGREHE